MHISDWSSDVCSSDLAGWLIRNDQQFHWTNDGYGSFDDFLAVLQSRKRKALRKEHADALADGQHGRAACRERVCQYVLTSVVDISLIKHTLLQMNVDQTLLQQP